LRITSPISADYGVVPADTPAILHHSDQSPLAVIVSLSAQHIAIRRHDERAGDLVVHFPRAGFVVRPS
jgi:hypothetical protein